MADDTKVSNVGERYAQALFDLDNDPFESASLPLTDGHLMPLTQQLTHLRDASRGGAGAVPKSPQRPLDSASEAELRSLGYVQ